MADIIKVKAKKAYEWNQDTKFVYVRIPVPAQTSLKKVDIFLSDLILRVTSLQKKSTHFLDLAYEVDYKSAENKFSLSDGEIHATLKKKEPVQWDKLLVEDISLSDLKNRRRESEARYEKNMEELEKTKEKLRDEYDRKATQEMMRFEEEERKVLQAKKKAQKDRAIEEIFSSGPSQKIQKAATNNFVEEKKQLTSIEHEQKKWREKQEQAMKMIMEEEEKEKQQLKNQKKADNEKKLITQIEKEVGLSTSQSSIRPTTSKSMFTEEDVDTYNKLREEVGETQYEQIPIRKANKVEVKFTERVFPHLAARDTYVKQPPMPKQKGSKGQSDGDIQTKNPLWLKDKGDSFLKDKNYTSAIQAYTQAIKLDPNMTGALANRSLCHLKIFNFSGVINDCESCLRVMRGNIGGSEEDNKKAMEFTVKIRTRLAMAKAWKGELAEARKEFQEVLANFDQLNPEIADQIRKGIQSITLREQSIGYKNKGDQQVKLGQYQKAIHFYDQSISVDKNQYSISNKSLCLNKLQNFTQSIETTNDGIEKINSFNMGFSVMGKDEGKVSESKRPQNILLKLYFRKAKAFEELGKIKEAQQTAHKGLAIDSMDKDFQGLLKEITMKKNKLIVKEEKQKAVQLIKQGNHSQALKIYSRCLKLIESCDDISQYLSILQNQCVCYLKQNDYDSIVSTSIRILKLINNLQSKIVEFGEKKSTTISRQELDKISVRTLMRRANAYLKKEQLYNAKSDLEKALEISPKDETVVKELAKIRQILGV